MRVNVHGGTSNHPHADIRRCSILYLHPMHAETGCVQGQAMRLELALVILRSSRTDPRTQCISLHQSRMIQSGRHSAQQTAHWVRDEKSISSQTPPRVSRTTPTHRVRPQECSSRSRLAVVRLALRAVRCAVGFVKIAPPSATRTTRHQHTKSEAPLLWPELG